MPGTAGHRGFGHIQKLPSKRWQASYVEPDTLRHHAPATFQAKNDAVAWLTAERKLADSGSWTLRQFVPGSAASPQPPRPARTEHRCGHRAQRRYIPGVELGQLQMRATMPAPDDAAGLPRSQTLLPNR